MSKLKPPQLTLIKSQLEKASKMHANQAIDVDATRKNVCRVLKRARKKTFPAGTISILKDIDTAYDYLECDK